MIKYICDVCGTEFNREHYTGGYIDHINLARNRYFYEDNLDELVEEVVFDDDSLRSKSDVEKRLNCVMHWDNLSDSVKEQVKMKVDTLYSKTKHMPMPGIWQSLIIFMLNIFVTL